MNVSESRESVMSGNVKKRAKKAKNTNRPLLPFSRQRSPVPAAAELGPPPHRPEIQPNAPPTRRLLHSPGRQAVALLIHSLTHSLTYSLTHLLTHSQFQCLTHTSHASESRPQVPCGAPTARIRPGAQERATVGRVDSGGLHGLQLRSQLVRM